MGTPAQVLSIRVDAPTPMVAKGTKRYLSSLSQSVSHYHTPTNGAHGPHSHSGLLFRAGWNLGIFLGLLAGIALQDDILGTLSYLLVGADLDEKGPRR